MRLRAAVSRRRAEVWREALLGRREGDAALQLRGTSCRTAFGALRSPTQPPVAAQVLLVLDNPHGTHWQ